MGLGIADERGLLGDGQIERGLGRIALAEIDGGHVLSGSYIDYHISTLSIKRQKCSDSKKGYGLANIIQKYMAKQVENLSLNMVGLLTEDEKQYYVDEHIDDFVEVKK